MYPLEVVMGFWEQARDQAGREAGARFWRWFLAGRALHRMLPAIVTLGVAVLLVWAYRLVGPDWGAIGSTAGEWVARAWPWVLLGAGALAVLAAVVWAGIRLWDAYGWRWRLRRWR